MSSLLQIKDVGDKTIEKLFEFVMKSDREITLLDFMGD
jgi:hypothetical protein